MNRFVFIGLIVLLVVWTGCTNKNNSDARYAKNEAKGSAEITFDTLIHHFGFLEQGEEVAFPFRFTNTGGEPLIIEDVQAGCGCTSTNWKKDPIPPGGKGVIEVIFNTEGRHGTQYKTIRVYTNTPKKEQNLVITAKVETNS